MFPIDSAKTCFLLFYMKCMALNLSVFFIGCSILPRVLIAPYILDSTKCRLQQFWALCSASQPPTPPSEETSAAQFKGQRQFLKGSWNKKIDENNLAGIGAEVVGVIRAGATLTFLFKLIGFRTSYSKLVSTGMNKHLFNLLLGSLPAASTWRTLNTEVTLNTEELGSSLTPPASFV